MRTAAAEVPVVERPEGIWDVIDTYDQKHVEAHKRLRDDFRELEEKFHDAVRILTDKQSAFNSQLTTLANTPVDVTKVALAPKVVAAVVALVMSVAGAFWVTTSGLRSDVRDILTRMATEQRVSDANAKLLEMNNATIKTSLENNTREMKDSLATISKRQDLLTLQYNELNDKITRLSVQKER